MKMKPRLFRLSDLQLMPIIIAIFVLGLTTIIYNWDSENIHLFGLNHLRHLIILLSVMNKDVPLRRLLLISKSLS